MRSRRYWMLAFAFLLASHVPSSAQIVFQRNAFVRVGGGYVGFSKIGRNRAFSVGFGRGFRSYQSTLIVAPAYPIYQPVIIAPPPVIVRPAIDPLLEDALLERALFLEMNPAVRPQPPQQVRPEEVRPPAPPPPAPAPEVRRDPPPPPPLRGQPAGRFRPLERDNRERAQLPIIPENPPNQPDPNPNPMRPVNPPGNKPPEPKFNNEKERLLFFGQQAFAQRQYGLAVERFRRASQLDPNDGVPHLLLGQAYLAVGKYRWAQEALLDGLELRQDWPITDFRPIDLYVDNGADYEAHLQALDKALERRPNDMNLRFLSGYIRWHEGRQQEAKAIFEDLMMLFPKPAVLQRYLESLPDGAAF